MRELFVVDGARDCLGHRGLLADEEMAWAMEHQAALLLGRLGLDKSHACSGDRFADCLGISGIVLLPVNVGLHVGRRRSRVVSSEVSTTLGRSPVGVNYLTQFPHAGCYSAEVRTAVQSSGKWQCDFTQ